MEAAPEPQLVLGNRTMVPSKSVLRKAVSELLQEEMLHRDIIREVLLLKKVYEDEDDEYVRHVSADPFSVMLYCRQQLDTLCQLSKKGELDLYFDATGSIMAKIAEQHRALLYSLVIKDEEKLPPISVGDFLSTYHTVPALVHFMQCIVRAGKVERGHEIHPRKVETDWSWALIQSCLNVFNRMTVKTYLKTAMVVHQRAYPRVQELTVVHLCTAHIMHNLSSNIRSSTKGNKKARKMMMSMMTCLINSTSLDEASVIFRDCCVILKSQTDTIEVQAALKRIRCRSSPYTHPEEDEESLKVTPIDILYEDITDDEGTIRAVSPFTEHFRSIEQGVEESEESAIGSPNVFRSEHHLKLLLDKYLPIYPLLSGMLLGNLERYLPDSSDIEPTDEQTETRDTNAPVEAWFKTIKIDVLRRKRGMRPATFIRKLRKTIRGRFREREYPSLTSSSTKRGRKKTPSKKRKKMSLGDDGIDVDLSEDGWCRDKKSKKPRRSDSKKTPSKKRNKMSLGDDGIDVDLSEDGWCRSKKSKKPRRSDSKKKCPRSNENPSTNVKYPAVPRWGGHVRDVGRNSKCTLQDTCVIDNIMTIVYVAYTSNAAFREIFDRTARKNETTGCLLDVIEQMAVRRFAEAKVIWLTHTGVISGRLPKLVNLYGSEWNRIGRHINHLVKSSVDSFCSSEYCPNQRRQQELAGITLR